MGAGSVFFFFFFLNFVKFAQVVIFLIFSQIWGYSNNGTTYFIFNTFHILGKCHKKIVIFWIFFHYWPFIFKQQICNKSILFPKYVSQHGENWPSKNHLVQVMELLIFSKKLGFPKAFVVG
jgi:hypothetical protein